MAIWVQHNSFLKNLMHLSAVFTLRENAEVTVVFWCFASWEWEVGGQRKVAKKDRR